MSEGVNRADQRIVMDGLWTAEFGTSAGMFGGGVVVFQNGRVLGGDGTYYYVGDYKLTGNEFQATIKSSPFIKGAASVFKTVGHDLTLEITGSLVDEDHAIGQGCPREMGALRFAVKLTRRD
jgi:hypothetical protein